MDIIFAKVEPWSTIYIAKVIFSISTTILPTSFIPSFFNMVGDSSENMVIASMWSCMAAWFTPVVLFGVMNLIVATIFIANSNNKDNNKDKDKDNKHNEQDQHEDYQVRGGGDIFSRLTRVNSLFERVKSINVTSYIATTTTIPESLPQIPAHLKKLATYSSLSRLAQSIHFPTLHGTRSTGGESTQSENPPPPRRTTSGRNRSSLERIKSVRFENTVPNESSQISDSLSQLVRAPSFVLERVKSLKIIKISSPFKSGAPITESEGPIDHNSIRSKSEKSSAKKSTAVEIKKTRSEIRLPASDDEEDYDSRRPETAREARNSGDAGVDAKADDFITRFRQQLKLQRVESLVRYNDILQRRTSN